MMAFFYLRLLHVTLITGIHQVYFTYILYSENVLKYYSGSTQDVVERICYHNITKRGFTSNGQPWKLVYAKEFIARRQAVALERRIKNRGAQRYIYDKINGLFIP